jgi:hypothetical protein
MTTMVYILRGVAFTLHRAKTKARNARGALRDDFGSNKQHTRTMGLKKLVNKWGIGRERGNE